MLNQKIALRKIAHSHLNCLTAEEHQLQSTLLVHKLADYLNQRLPSAAHIAIYSALPSEPDLSLLASLCPERQFYYPLVLGKESMSFHLIRDLATLKPGSYGIIEPNPQIHSQAMPADLDLVLVPGLAFDLSGNRLGRGKGYYDRYLAQIPETPTIGIGYNSQLTQDLPHESHDRAMSYLATDCGIIPI